MTEIISSLIGIRYAERGLNPETGFDCFGLARYVLMLHGIEVPVNIREARREFVPCPPPSRFLDIAYFKNLDPLDRRHIAVMLDERWALQCSHATGGVGRIEITRWPWALSLWGFLRHKRLTEDGGRTTEASVFGLLSLVV